MPIVQPGSIITMGSSNLTLSAVWLAVPYVVITNSPTINGTYPVFGPDPGFKNWVFGNYSWASVYGYACIGHVDLGGGHVVATVSPVSSNATAEGYVSDAYVTQEMRDTGYYLTNGETFNATISSGDPWPDATFPILTFYGF